MSIFGCDVSKWNGNVNFNELKATGKVQFVVIKATDGMDLEPSLANQVAGCKAYNMPYAFYCFGEAKSIVESIQEAKFLLSRIVGTKPLFIAYDAESSNLSALSKNETTDVVNGFCSTIKSAGYTACFYCNDNWMRNELDAQFLKNKGYYFWYAKYNGTTPDTANNSSICDIWQYSETGKLNGNGSSAIDLDVAYNTNLIREINLRLGVNVNPNYCDTTIPFIKNLGETYTFKSGSPISCGSKNIFNEIGSKVENGYYLTTYKAIGHGSAGFYVNGIRKTIGTVK